MPTIYAKMPKKVPERRVYEFVDDRTLSYVYNSYLKNHEKKFKH